MSLKDLATYRIIVRNQENPVEQQAAEKLQHYLHQLLQKDLEITKEATYVIVTPRR